jgi:rubrerythrin
MSVATRVSSDRQLARLLQIGVVLEEVVEARAYHHYHSLPDAERDALTDEIESLLEHAAEESANHRERLEALVVGLDADSVPFEEIEALVEAQYEGDSDFDGILYDQLAGEETAYKFYDDLIAAIEDSEATFGIDRERLLAELRALRDDEEEGVEEVANLMEET